MTPAAKLIVEPVTQKQVDSLIGAIGFFMGVMVARLGNVDLSKGRGVLQGNDRCLWTKDRCRITISLADNGGCCMSMSCSKQPDPECPA